MAMIRVTPRLAIDEREIAFDYITASGPGGQNVNKVASAVQLRFDAAGSPALDPAFLHRLAVLAGRRMTREGILCIHAQRFRSQERNRQDALERLLNLLRAAAVIAKPRRPTRPGPAAEERRLQEKRHRAARKRDRGAPID